MYYRMCTDQLQLTTRIDKMSGPAISKFYGGDFYSPRKGKSVAPFRFNCFDRYGNPLPDYVAGECLMSRRLVGAIEAAGAGNLQKFEAQLVNEKTGAVNNGYMVVNILGLVAAADLSRSKSLPLGGGHVFTDLKLEPGKVPTELLIFRLAESLVDVIVHERVARAIESGGFRGVLVEPLTSAE